MTVTLNTNKSAMVALQNLATTNRELDSTQKRISTSYKVADALDDAGVFAVAQSLRGDVKALDAVSSALARAIGVAEMALAGAEIVSDLVQEVTAKITQMSNDALSTSERDAYESDLVALTGQITNAISQSTFSGKNVLTDPTTTNAVFLADENGSTISIRGQDLDADAATLIAAIVGSITGSTTGQAAQTALSTFENAVNSTLGELGADTRSVELQQQLLTKRIDATEKGIGALVDADLGKEAAKLQALQVKQQLGTQALSIANQRPQIILNLFQ